MYDFQVLFGDADGFGDRIDVRAGARLVGPVSEMGFALLSVDFDSNSKFYLIKANAIGGELLASFDPPAGMSGPRQLSVMHDGSLEVTANVHFGSNPGKQFGTLAISADGEVGGQVQLRFIELTYGKELADAVAQYLKDRSSV